MNRVLVRQCEFAPLQALDVATKEVDQKRPLTGTMREISQGSQADPMLVRRGLSLTESWSRNRGGQRLILLGRSVHSAKWPNVNRVAA
mgnify:CR=1 FL=1